jgi:predicted double-glycine peptidase
MSIEDLEKNIDRELPVLISVQIKRQPYKDIKKIRSKGHFILAIGYDNKNIYFADPRFTFTTYLSKEELDDRWHDSDNYPNMVKIRRQHYGIVFDPPNNWKLDDTPKHLIDVITEFMNKYKLLDLKK